MATYEEVLVFDEDGSSIVFSCCCAFQPVCTATNESNPKQIDR